MGGWCVVLTAASALRWRDARDGWMVRGATAASALRLRDARDGWMVRGANRG